MKELDDNLPPELEDILDENESALRVEKLVQENVAANFVSCSEVHKPTAVPVEIVEKPGVTNVLKCPNFLLIISYLILFSPFSICSLPDISILILF